MLRGTSCSPSRTRLLPGTSKMIADIQIPPIMKIGAGAFGEIPAVLKRLNCSRPLIVTDLFLVGQGIAR